MTTCFELLIPTYRGRDEDVSNANSRNNLANGSIKDTKNHSNTENLTQIHDTSTMEGSDNSVVCSPSNQKIDKGKLDFYSYLVSFSY